MAQNNAKLTCAEFDAFLADEHLAEDMTHVAKLIEDDEDEIQDLTANAIIIEEARASQIIKDLAVMITPDSGTPIFSANLKQEEDIVRQIKGAEADVRAAFTRFEHSFSEFYSHPKKKTHRNLRRLGSAIKDYNVQLERLKNICESSINILNQESSRLGDL